MTATVIGDSKPKALGKTHHASREALLRDYSGSGRRGSGRRGSGWLFYKKL